MMGNYKTIEGGWPRDGGTSLMGTWGESLSSSSYTSSPSSFFTLVKGWDTQNAIMWAATSTSINGIIGGHAYSMTHAITLSNG
jgi:hypothetical protein